MINKFVLVHSYNKLVDDDKAKPLVCPDDQQELVSMIDADGNTDDPVMWCPLCDTKYRFGLDTWNQIEAVVKEHYDI